MGKRGQADVIKYFITAIVIILILLFGFNAVKKLNERTCKTELAKFEISLNDLGRGLKYGDVMDFTENAPCNADEIYFFDLERKTDPMLLEHLPLIKNALEEGVQENVFVLKEGRLLGSFYSGNVEISYPNYICLIPKYGKISFFLEGKGQRAHMASACSQPECTYIPVGTENEDAVGVINEAVSFGNEGGCENCPGEPKEAFSDFAKTRPNVDIFRKYEYCKEDGRTSVEIVIRPKGNAHLKNFRFFESLPKECIDDLQQYLAAEIKGNVEIKFDPLIIWSFEDVEDEEKISYILNAGLTDQCKEAIEGIGISDIIENGVELSLLSDNEFSSTIERHTGLWLNSGSIVLPVNNPKSTINLHKKTQYNGNKNGVSYRIIGSASDGTITCALDAADNKQLRCEAREYKGEPFALKVQATDGKYTSEGTFSIMVGANRDSEIKAKCGDSVCDSNDGESCSECPRDCGKCPQQTKAGDYSVLSCEQIEEQCEFPFTDACEGYGSREQKGKCFGVFRNYKCVNKWQTEGCVENALCPEGYTTSSREACLCRQTDTSCGTYPGCWDCNSFDRTGVVFCQDGDAYQRVDDYGCSNERCKLSSNNVLVQKCGSGCENGQCL